MAEDLLLYASRVGDIHQVTTLIVEAKANVNTCNSMGVTPLHIAAEKGYISILEMFLTQGANPNVCNALSVGGKTPLHLAVDEGIPKVVETLLQYYANPNIQDSQGFTALHIAARRGFFVIAQMLLLRGCDATILDNFGKSAWYWAKEYKHPDIEGILPPLPYNFAEQCKKTKELVVTFIEKPKAKGAVKKKKGGKKGGKKKKK